MIYLRPYSMKILFVIVFFIFLQGCASERLQRVSAQERNAFTCEDIRKEMRLAYAEIEVQKEDSRDLEPKGIFAVFTVINWPFLAAKQSSAEESINHANARFEDLNQLKKEKGCPPETGRFIADADKK